MKRMIHETLDLLLVVSAWLMLLVGLWRGNVVDLAGSAAIFAALIHHRLDVGSCKCADKNR